MCVKLLKSMEFMKLRSGASSPPTILSAGFAVAEKAKTLKRTMLKVLILSQSPEAN